MRKKTCVGVAQCSMSSDLLDARTSKVTPLLQIAACTCKHTSKSITVYCEMYIMVEVLIYIMVSKH